MKKINAALLLCVLAPFAHAAGVSGLPSKPKFVGPVEITGSPITPVTHPQLRFSGSTNTVAGSIKFRRNGKQFWHLEADSSPSSPLVLYRYDDNGAYLGTPLDINRQTGVATFEVVKSIQSCATGYLRVSVNDCRVNGYAADTAATGGTCTALAAPATGAQYMDVAAELTVLSQNLVGFRSVSLAAYTDAACTSQDRAVSGGVYEQFATALNTTLARLPVVMRTRIVSGNVYLKSANNFSYRVVSYTD